jgi:hypothetical protein
MMTHFAAVRKRIEAGIPGNRIFAKYAAVLAVWTDHPKTQL